jgi:DNA polymerase (family 10)
MRIHNADIARVLDENADLLDRSAQHRGGESVSRARQTERVLAALDAPRLHVLAHPTGRLIDTREPCDIDMAALIPKAEATGTALELNAHPERLDLLEPYCRMAKDEGALVAIDSDSHSEMEFDKLRFGVGRARRGWIEARDCLNTRSIMELKGWLEKGHETVK